MPNSLPDFVGCTGRTGEDTGIVSYDFVWGSIFMPQPHLYEFFVPPHIGISINRIGKRAGLFNMMGMVGLQYSTNKEIEEDKIWYSYDTKNTPDNIRKLQQIALMARNADKIAGYKRKEEEEKSQQAEVLFQEGIQHVDAGKTFNLKRYAQVRGYPYYLAIYQESRMRGNYPAGVKGNKALEKMVDRSVGMAHRELKSESIQDLLNQLRQKGIEPAYDDVHFYMVRAPNSSREGIQYQRLLAMMRSANGVKEVKVAVGPFSEYPFSQDLSFMTDADWVRLERNRDENSRINNRNFRIHKETCEICQDGFMTNTLCTEGFNLLRGKASGLKPGEIGEKVKGDIGYENQAK